MILQPHNRTYICLKGTSPHLRWSSFSWAPEAPVIVCIQVLKQGPPLLGMVYTLEIQFEDIAFQTQHRHEICMVSFHQTAHHACRLFGKKVIMNFLILKSIFVFFIYLDCHTYCQFIKIGIGLLLTTVQVVDDTNVRVDV